MICADAAAVHTTAVTAMAPIDVAYCMESSLRAWLQLREGWLVSRTRLDGEATTRHHVPASIREGSETFLSQRHEAQIPVRGTRLDDLLQLPAAACRPLRHNPI